eukprot:m.187625 g.187625  ORF g.187625 m.187625 type:complete len:66 (-) comp10549_c0_seq1:38-235(-)
MSVGSSTIQGRVTTPILAVHVCAVGNQQLGNAAVSIDRSIVKRRDSKLHPEAVISVEELLKGSTS